jgi:hypothetical protein
MTIPHPAGFLRIFATIMVPPAKPALATVTILETINDSLVRSRSVRGFKGVVPHAAFDQ